MQNQALKFEVVTAKKVSEKLADQTSAGYSLLIDGNNYYLLKLFLFEKYFFIVKNQSQQKQDYTVYSSKYPNEPKFLNPVGTARLRPEMKDHLEIQIPLIGSSLFMSLYPSK